MRLLLTEHRAAPAGGSERSLLELAGALSARGHEIHLGYQIPGEFLPLYRELRVSAFHLSTVRLERPSRRGLLSLIASAARASRVRPDVVHVNMPFDVVYGAFAALGARAPLVCHLRAWPPESFDWLSRVALASATRFIAVSDDVRRRWTTAGLTGARVAVVHNGVDPSRYRSPAGPVRSRTRAELGVDDSDLLVVYAGRISPEKGIETLLDAFERTRASVPHAQLRLGCCETVPQKQGYDRGLKARRGPWVWSRPQTDMRSVFGAADLVVVPSTGPEPFARVALEAMACGCPVVASRTGGLPELFTGRLEQLLVPPGDSAALAAKMQWALGWREHSPELGQACREHVASTFTLERTRAGVEDVLIAATEEHRVGRSSQNHQRLVGWRRRVLALNADAQHVAIR